MDGEGLEEKKTREKEKLRGQGATSRGVGGWAGDEGVSRSGEGGVGEGSMPEEEEGSEEGEEGEGEGGLDVEVKGSEGVLAIR